MPEAKPGVYDIDFGVYDIEFAVGAQTPPDSSASSPVQNTVQAPSITVEVEVGEEEYLPPIELDPGLSEAEQTLVDFLRAQQRGRTHIGELVRRCFDTDRLPKKQFAQLRNMLDDLKLKGYVIHEESGDYYGAPDEPVNLCRCFHARVCNEVDTSNPEKAQKVAICFVGKLIERASELIDDKVVGMKASNLAKDYATQMRIPESDAKKLVQNLRKEQLLFVSSRHRGSLLVTTDAAAAMP